MLNFNVAPYFDNFDANDKFYRILYRPSYAVQARELTQSQSILQEQVRKFGNHVFEQGAMVIPGQITLDTDVSYQKMEFTYGTPPNDVEVDPENFLGYTIIGESSGVEADVINVAAADSTDPLTFILKFKDSGDNNESPGFWDGETVYRKDNIQIRATCQGTLDEDNPTYTNTDKCAITSIDAGVYYFNGLFVDNDKQSIIVSKYDQRPTAKVGLRVYESIITPEEDLSLTDNAQGSPNYAAPGAHRYKIDLKLESLDYDGDTSDDFITLQYLKAGKVVKEIRTSAYSELEKTFARRTYDESGDYTVRPFSILMREHLRDEDVTKYKEGVNFVADGGDSTKLMAEMGTGKAYVRGFEIENISTSLVPIDKARDYAISNNSVTNFSLGNYVKITNVHNIPQIDNFGEVKLYDDFIDTPGDFNGTEVGTARVRAIKRFDDDAYLYLFDISMGDGYSFETDVLSIYDSNTAGSQNFTADIIQEEGVTVLYRTANNQLIFPMPHPYIKTLSVGGSGIDTNYQSQRAYFNTGAAGNIVTLVAQDDEVFQQNTADYYVTSTSDGAEITGLNFNFTGSPTGKVLEITATPSIDSPVNIIAPVVKNISTQKTKNLVEGATVVITAPNKKQGLSDSLRKADVVKVHSVKVSNSINTAPTVDDTDIRDRYQMDTGQRDNYYDVGRIILKGGQNPPEGQLLVTFDYFTHTDGDYFSVDSYVDIDFDQIPVYSSRETGMTYSLADCLDFRPRMADAGDGFVGAGAEIGELPQVFTDIRADYEYYLNRIDYLYLDYTGEFRIARGIPAVNPVPPEKPESAMICYELYIPAYTFKPGDVEPSYKDNKRYTMKDIGDLDRRLGNVEYYTLLSLLERETASMEILDGNGLNRFKNGFVVDPFDSHLVGDATHTDYNCSIDPKNQIMRPKFNDENIGLLYDAINSTGVQRTGGIVTLPYTHTPINKQIQASKYENINPFAFRNIFGEIKFNPDSDVWHDKERVPTLVVNHSPNYEALKYIADNVGDLNGVEWGRWEDVGGRKNVQSSTRSGSSSSTTSRQDTGISHDEGWLQTTTTSWSTTRTTWDQDQSRSGIKQTHKDSNVVSDSLGDRITEVNYIPYMRSIPVLIKTEQMKKKTKVYPFFDNVAMSSHCDPPSQNEYCTPASIINCSSISGDFYTNNYGEELILGGTSGASAIVVFQTPSYLKVINIKGTFQVGETIVGNESFATAVVSSVELKQLGDPIITGEYGEVALVWQIPNDDVLSFMTGEREFVLNDQITNADPVHTYAKGMFKSHGMSSKSQDTVLSTKTITFTKENVKQDRTLSLSSTSSSSSSRASGWYDPIAQSFLINEAGGCFLTKVAVWFQSKDEEEAVVCEIRNMVNGYPAQIAMTSATVQPRKVSTSERTPGNATEFVFPEPIYLQDGVDYCFVLKPAVASASYNIWVAETGRNDLNSGQIITGKESLGSLFKSQNASTWTPNQNEDIMFQLSKAVFDITADGECQLVNDTIKPDRLQTNPLETTSGSSVVRVYQKDHGLTVGSFYKISGCVDGDVYNGILGSALNGEHTILDLEIDSFTFDCGTVASETGLTGGTNVSGIRNYQMDVAHPLVNELILDGTSVDWTMQTCTGTSVNGTQTPYEIEDFINVINNEDIDMSAPMVVASQLNETRHLNMEKSFKMRGYLTSINENVSPIVDAALYDASGTGEDTYFKQSSSTLIAVSNRVDFPSTTTWDIGATSAFSVGNGENELVVTHTDHELGTGAFILIENFSDSLGTSVFDPNGLHEIRVLDKDTYTIAMEDASTGYTGSGGGTTTITYSETHFKYVPESESFNCSTASRYMTKQVTLENPAENFKIYFGAVREQEADIDVYYKTRSPYSVGDWNSIDWIRLDDPDEDVAISQNNKDFKEYNFTVEDLEPYNAIAVKLVMKSTNSTQVPIFTDFRLICTT
jgi:hypothetical protein